VASARAHAAAWALLAALAVPAAAQAPADQPPAAPAEAAPAAPPRRPWDLFGALGLSQRLDWGEGRSIPLLAVALDHREFLGGLARLEARYVTTWLSVEGRTPWGAIATPCPLYLGLGGDTEIQSGLQTPYRYRDGDYLRRRVFYTTYADATLLAGFDAAPGAPTAYDVQLRYQLRRHWFEDAPDTLDGFPLPTNHVEHRASLELVFDGRRRIRSIEIRRGWGVWASAGHALREKWRNWGDTPDTLLRSVRRHQEYEWAALATGWWQPVGDTGHVRVELGGAAGDDLDRISGFGVGSVFGTFPFTWPLPGYYYAEFKADRVLLLSTDYSADLTPHLRGYAYLDTGAVRAIGARTRWHTSVGVGLRVGIDVGGPALLPILIRYHYAPRAHRGASSRGGHEVAVRVLFAL
jgi:hypothetical protein